MDRYSLRAWEISDCDSLAENANNINVWNNVRDYFPHPYAVNDARIFITKTLEKDSIEDFAIIINGKAVGGIGFIPLNDVERLSAEIGYWLGETYWNNGIMTSVLKDTVNYIFENTEIIRVFAAIFEHNTPSMKVLEKAGFQKIGILHKAAIKNNKIIDMHYYELVKKTCIT